MDETFLIYSRQLFEALVQEKGFTLKTELSDGQSYMIEYDSGNYVVKIVNYFRELYVTLYKMKDPKNGINLFNLLEYINRNDLSSPKEEYFRKEKNLNECYKKQLEYILSVVYENHAVIDDFFREGNYDLNCSNFEEFWKKKHPELYNHN